MKTLARLRPADSLTILFLLFLTALSLAFHGKIQHVRTLLFTYSLLLLMQVFLSKHAGFFSGNRLMDLVRSLLFPVVCVLIIFDSLEGLVHSVHPRDIDPLLIRLDYLIFGGYPTVMLESIYSPLLTDILQTAYATYYFLPICFGLILKLQGRELEFDRTLFLILFCFYLSYIGYLLFPALGPRYVINHLQSADLTGAGYAEHIQRFLNTLEGVKRDAFPSGHTGIAVVVSVLAYRFHRRFFFVTLPVIVALIFSTVYCRYHYVVDILGGFILAATTLLVGESYYGWYVRKHTDR
ncbi:MAG: phosphatase PAP2 family protein [Thermodesulfovibrionales bacterium]